MKSLLTLLVLVICKSAVAQQFHIPEVGELPRIDRSSPRPANEILRNSAFILKFKEHAPLGDSYVILTDHSAAGYLKPLQQLVRHRKATLIKIADLAEVHQPETLRGLRGKLAKLKPKYVALAPRMESYRENMLLGMWELLTTLDEDPYL
ncbi:MAG: hypothetical protein VX633_00475, partial [Verrucomicrobiota bacterium]|nr:hypothetical protein [Verrucomicrobiota bacterium]